MLGRWRCRVDRNAVITKALPMPNGDASAPVDATPPPAEHPAS